MQVVCEATQCNNEEIQVVALQNLVKIMSLYYVHMEAYMGPALFAVSWEWRVEISSWSAGWKGSLVWSVFIRSL